jgi:hypothetical protein
MEFIVEEWCRNKVDLCQGALKLFWLVVAHKDTMLVLP